MLVLVGQKTNYDKLALEIWTNGTITPQVALVEGSTENTTLVRSLMVDLR